MYADQFARDDTLEDAKTVYLLRFVAGTILQLREHPRNVIHLDPLTSDYWRLKAFTRLSHTVVHINRWAQEISAVKRPEDVMSLVLARGHELTHLKLNRGSPLLKLIWVGIDDHSHILLYDEGEQRR